MIDKSSISETIMQMDGVEAPHVIRTEQIKKIFKAEFSRTDSELYDVMDVFFYTLLSEIIRDMKSRGVRQPGIENFIRSFNLLTNTNVFIGNIHIKKDIFTDAKIPIIVDEVLKIIAKKGIDKLIDGDLESGDIDIKEWRETGEEDVKELEERN